MAPSHHPGFATSRDAASQGCVCGALDGYTVAHSATMACNAVKLAGGRTNPKAEPTVYFYTVRLSPRVFEQSSPSPLPRTFRRAPADASILHGSARLLNDSRMLPQRLSSASADQVRSIRLSRYWGICVVMRLTLARQRTFIASLATTPIAPQPEPKQRNQRLPNAESGRNPTIASRR